MIFKYDRKKYNKITYTLVTVLIIVIAFIMSIITSRMQVEKEANDALRVQATQIKDDLSLQIISDNENLVTMASFASKLYESGEDYSLMLDSFKPVGLFSKIGILSPDGTFSTKYEKIDLSGKVSFAEEVSKGQYIDPASYSHLNPDEKVIISAVPIMADGKAVGIIYGIIKPGTLKSKFGGIINDLDARLVIYDKKSQQIIVDTENKTSGELSQFEGYRFNMKYSYENLVVSSKGFLSFKSPSGKNIHSYFSTIEELKWGVMLARDESKVFSETHRITKNLLISFLVMLLAVSVYLYLIVYTEKTRTKIATETSDVRKLLLSVNKKHTNIEEALKNVKHLLGARAAFYIDTEGVDYNDGFLGACDSFLVGDDRRYFISELFKSAKKAKDGSDTSVRIVRFVCDKHLRNQNIELYNFLVDKKIKEVAAAIISEENNLISILGVTNPCKRTLINDFMEGTAVCFSIAVYNNKNLDKTERAATTDVLTGLCNRVAFVNDVAAFDKGNLKSLSCVYVDANELNLINNKHGHMAGDQMLICIADTLRAVFDNENIYRIGGDEFIVFAKETEKTVIEEKADAFLKQIKEKNYSVALGISYREHGSDWEEMVREAEVGMYDSKAKHYQKKDSANKAYLRANENLEHVSTGIKEVDILMSILKDHYYGIFNVSLKSNTLHRVLTPTYLGYDEKEKNFSDLLLRYINDNVRPDDSRLLMSFLNFSTLENQLREGNLPEALYKTLSGETVRLSVYNLSDENDEIDDTLWVFERE